MIEQFHRPATVREALGLQRRFQGRSAFLAGGTWLNSRDAAPHPAHCISLERLGLDRVEAQQGQTSIGATCTLQRLLDDRRVPAALRAALAQVVSRNIRNAATLGGHLASRPAVSDVIPMLIALDAKVVLARPGGTKTLRVADYAARPEAGLITKLVVPKPGAGRLAACRNVRGSANGRSVVSAAVSLSAPRGLVQDAVIAIAGVARHVVRLTPVEEELDGRPLPPPDELQAKVSRRVRPGATPSASAAFRRYEAGVAVALAFRDALRQKRGRR